MGTGAAVARHAARAGLNVVGMHRGNHPEEADALAAEIRAEGRACEMIVANAGKPELLPELVAAVGGIAGPRGVRLMVYAVADASVGRLIDPERMLVPKQIHKTFDVMAHSFLFWTQQLFAAGLLADGARIIALLNYLDSSVITGGGAIGPSKAALAAYVRFLGAELGPHGVRVNGIRFGAADTYAASLMPGFELALAQLARTNPLGRNVTTDDVGQFVSLLLDDRASFVNGAVLALDGGEEAGLIQHCFVPR